MRRRQLVIRLRLRTFGGLRCLRILLLTVTVAIADLRLRFVLLRLSLSFGRV